MVPLILQVPEYLSEDLMPRQMSRLVTWSPQSLDLTALEYFFMGALEKLTFLDETGKCSGVTSTNKGSKGRQMAVSFGVFPNTE